MEEVFIRLLLCSTLVSFGCVDDDAESLDELDLDERSAEPTVVAGNPTCASLGLGNFELKVDPPASGTYSLGGSNTAALSISGSTVAWSSTMGIDAVLVKGGPAAQVYTYDPEATSGTGLHAPINPANGTPYGVSHVTFCYDFDLEVSKTANTKLDRAWTWTIRKWAAANKILLTPGQSYAMQYSVEPIATGSHDGNWGVSGTITIKNPAPVAAKITSVTDVIDGSIAAPVTCGVAFPYDLPANSTLVCSYAAALPSGSDRTNVATATTAPGLVGSGSGTAAVRFANAAVNEIDECIALHDDRYGSLGTRCAGNQGVIVYTMNIGPFETCGTSHDVQNTATFVANDTGATGSSTAVVHVDVAPCQLGCTLTQGYWKTHSSYGPAPYDSAWENLPGGADTSFFLSGTTYLGALNQPPAGNPYWQLARQYIAAQLNGLNGASMTAIQTQFNAATTLFNTYSPSQVTGSVRGQFTALVGPLDSFNQGTTGPGHCTE